MHPNIIKIQERIEPLRQEIINHKVYSAISELEDLRIFMEHHIFAVWDFMSLLKALQINLNCTTLPWFPVGDPVTRQLINEIVAGEESDVDGNGAIKSHFELYLDAMNQCGANTKPINTFLDGLKNGKSFNEAFEIAEVPATAKDFVNATFETINSGKTHLQAASFTFGREDLIPAMFTEILRNFQSNFPETNLDKLIYYFERHIELDTDEHGPMAMQMISELCDGDATKWQEVEEISKAALEKRIGLWNAIEEKMLQPDLASI
jgi:hypothetical protein